MINYIKINFYFLKKIIIKKKVEIGEDIYNKNDRKYQYLEYLQFLKIKKKKKDQFKMVDKK